MASKKVRKKINLSQIIRGCERFVNALQMKLGHAMRRYVWRKWDMGYGEAEQKRLGK